MKLAFCLFKYFPFGGLQRDMLLMATEAKKRGYDVHIFCGSWQGETPPDMSIHRLTIKGYSNTAKTKSYYQQLTSELEKYAFNLIVGFNKMPGLDLYFAADSCFACKAYNERGWLYRQSPRSKVYLEYEAAVFGRHSNTEILEISKNERAHFIDFYKTDSGRFHSLPPGISRNRLIPDNAEEIRTNTRLALGFNSIQPVLLALGSGFKTKGLDRSIATVATLSKTDFPDIQLLVVGQDNPKAYIKQAKKLQIAEQLRFLGGRDDIPNLLQAADLLIHLAYKENSGIALLEALTAGLPVVTTDACGYANYITETNMGYVVNSPYDSQKPVDAIKALLAIDRAEWHKRGRDFSTHSDIYSLHSKAVDVMEKVAANIQATC